MPKAAGRCLPGSELGKARFRHSPDSHLDRFGPLSELDDRLLLGKADEARTVELSR